MRGGAANAIEPGERIAAGSPASERLSLRAELDRRIAGQRLTPAQRRIAQCLVENSAQIGFLSSMELARLADVSQPSVTRFAMALGFEGYLEMRRFLRSSVGGMEPSPDQAENRFQTAAKAEIANLAELAETLADEALVEQFGRALAASRPLPVVGLRASSGLATQFAYFAAKVHPDIRLLAGGGTLLEDQLEQAKAAGAQTLLAFMMPLHPRETVKALEFARQTGLKVALVTDASFDPHAGYADLVLSARANSSLVFDSFAAPALLVGVLLDAMCNRMSSEARQRLEQIDRSSKRRKVFAR